MQRLALASVGVLLLGITGCKPDYPKCDNDDHCKDKNEFCVNGRCQQCRNDKDCKAGQTCKGGRCEGGCQSNADCPDGQACKKGKCAPCTGDADCEGGKCKSGKCLKPGACNSNSDCPENQECQDGRCAAPPKPSAPDAKCTPRTIYFDFNEFVLSSDSTATLKSNAECIKSEPNRKVRVEGHCDPRGTEEYNLALGDRRARAVTKYLQQLGIPAARFKVSSKGKLEATGSDEAGWSKDRKVVFTWE